MTTSSEGHHAEAVPSEQVLAVAEHTEKFLNHEGANLHPALDPMNETLVQSSSGQTAAPFQNKLTELYTEDFQTAVQAYERTKENPKTKALEIKDEQSWADVIQRLREAEAKYLDVKDQRIRKLSRTVTDHSASVLPYVRLIPNTMALSVLAGGLRLIVEAASRLSEQRSEVLRSLFRIPFVIIKADEFCDNFGHDPVLLAKAEKVYVAALVAIEGTIAWLSGAKRKSFWATLRGPLYNNKFEDKLSDLEQALDFLEAHVDAVRDRTLNHVKGGIERLEGAVDGLSNSQEQAQVEMSRHLQQISKDAIEEMKKVLADTNSTAKWMKQKDHDISRLKKRIQELERASAALTTEDLIDVLNVGRNDVLFDLRKVLNAVPDSDESHMALGITTNLTFKAWQADDESSAFFLDGRASLISHRYISAMSIVSSYLIQDLQSNPQATTIYFYCGHHTSTGDQLQGPPGMMRSLLAQLLHLFPINLDFIPTRLRQQLEILNFRALCECFSRFVRHLSVTTTLFCIIDSVNFFETRSWTNDTLHALEVLQDLMEDGELNAIMKVLVTSPVRTRFIRDLFAPESRLTIQNEEGGGRHAPTQREISEASRRPRRTPQREIVAALRARPFAPAVESDNDWDA